MGFANGIEPAMPKSVAPTKSVSGAGLRFEDKVVAYYLSFLIVDQPPFDPSWGTTPNMAFTEAELLQLVRRFVGEGRPSVTYIVGQLRNMGSIGTRRRSAEDGAFRVPGTQLLGVRK